MMHEGLSPAVQDSEETDLRPEMLGIGGDRTERFGGRTKEDAVDLRFVLISDDRNLVRDGEHDVEVFAVEQFGRTVLDPRGAGQRLDWRHLRTTNIIESPFATVRLRQRVTNGAGSRAKALIMAFNLLAMAESAGER